MLKTSILTLLNLCFCLAIACAAQDGREQVFYNAKVFTANPEHPYAEAVAVRGDKIVAVGNRAEVAKAVSAGAELIDLKGKFLMPGLIDSHAHALEGGLSLISAMAGEEIETVPQLAAFAAEAKRSGRGMQGDILYIGGIPLRIWTKNKELNATFNAGAFANQPVFLEGMDGHTAFANKVLLKRAGVDRELIRGLDAVGRGYYGVGANLEPNGFMVDKGIARVSALLPEPSAERMLEGGRAAVAYMHQLGITAWLDPRVDAPIIRAYRTLAERGELNSHVGMLARIRFKTADPDTQLAQALVWREELKSVPDVKIIGIKVFADGVVEYPSQTAVMSKPYRSGKNGELLFDPVDFARITVAADKAGLIMHVHAIGDQAVTEALNGIAAARKASGKLDVPHTITHLQFIRPDDIPRFHDLGVIASFQLYWANAGPDAIDIVKPYIDPELYKWMYPARSVLDTSGIIAGASDWPVSTANVFQAIYQAETRKGPQGVLDASQRVPREAMLYAYTRNAARALAEEEHIGSIAPGKQADFAVLDRDVLTVTAEQARDTKVLWTIVGGKGVYGTKP
jgi:predicted amidohydrolase YtcJ